MENALTYLSLYQTVIKDSILASLNRAKTIPVPKHTSLSKQCVPTLSLKQNKNHCLPKIVIYVRENTNIIGKCAMQNEIYCPSSYV